MNSNTWIADAREGYASKGIGGRLSVGHRLALLVVDLAVGFTDDAWAPGCDLDGVVERTAELVRLARTKGHPVIFTTIAFAPDALEGHVWLAKMPGLRCMTGCRRARGHRSDDVRLHPRDRG